MFVCLDCFFVSFLLLNSGKQSATASAIFDKMNSVLQGCNIPWINCVGVSVDNTSVNLGKNNSIFTRVMEKNSATFFMGCPCHIIHNTSMKATEIFSKVIIILNNGHTCN